MKLVVQNNQFISVQGGQIGRRHGDTTTMTYNLE